MEKTYNITWKYGIMKDLHGFGLSGRLPDFINNFLKDRCFKVWVGSTFSDSYNGFRFSKQRQSVWISARNDISI